MPSDQRGCRRFVCEARVLIEGLKRRKLVSISRYMVKGVKMAKYKRDAFWLCVLINDVRKSYVS